MRQPSKMPAIVVVTHLPTPDGDLCSEDLMRTSLEWVLKNKYYEIHARYLECRLPPLEQWVAFRQAGRADIGELPMGQNIKVDVYDPNQNQMPPEWSVAVNGADLSFVVPKRMPVLCQGRLVTREQWENPAFPSCCPVGSRPVVSGSEARFTVRCDCVADDAPTAPAKPKAPKPKAAPPAEAPDDAAATPATHPVSRAAKLLARKGILKPSDIVEPVGDIVRVSTPAPPLDLSVISSPPLSQIGTGTVTPSPDRERATLVRVGPPREQSLLVPTPPPGKPVPPPPALSPASGPDVAVRREEQSLPTPLRSTIMPSVGEGSPIVSMTLPGPADRPLRLSTDVTPIPVDLQPGLQSDARRVTVVDPAPTSSLRPPMQLIPAAASGPPLSPAILRGPSAATPSGGVHLPPLVGARPIEGGSGKLALSGRLMPTPPPEALVPGDASPVLQRAVFAASPTPHPPAKPRPESPPPAAAPPPAQCTYTDPLTKKSVRLDLDKLHQVKCPVSMAAPEPVRNPATGETTCECKDTTCPDQAVDEVECARSRLDGVRYLPWPYCMCNADLICGGSPPCARLFRSTELLVQGDAASGLPLDGLFLTSSKCTSWFKDTWGSQAVAVAGGQLVPRAAIDHLTMLLLKNMDIHIAMDAGMQREFESLHLKGYCLARCNGIVNSSKKADGVRGEPRVTYSSCMQNYCERYTVRERTRRRMPAECDPYV